MAKIQYIEGTLNDRGMAIVALSNKLINRYAGQGFILTLRQLYYQLVALGKLENKQKNYKRLGEIINRARMLGLIDWDAIEDRTRNLRDWQYVGSPQLAVKRAARSYARDLWSPQAYGIEIWVEKDALAGVVERTASLNRVPYFSCRGYTSQSEMHGAALRLQAKIAAGKQMVILHLGDHDPSGIDMTRDIRARLKLFMGESFEKLTIRRVALLKKHIELYRPPPNPAKITDSRYAAYSEKYGQYSWELDALSPTRLHRIMQWHIDKFRDVKLWNASLANEKREKAALMKVSKRWADVDTFLNPRPEF